MPVDVKNPAELRKIPEDTLFVSESGYAYDTDQLISYFKGEMKHKIESQGWNTGIYFHDYNNTAAGAGVERICNLFSANDVARLMERKDVRDVIENNSNMALLLSRGKCINGETIALIKAVADASKVIQGRMAVFWSEELSNAISDLYHHLQEYPKVMETLQIMTVTGPLKEYATGRGGKNLVDDILKIMNGQSCSAGFQRDISYVFAALQSARTYAIVTKALETGKSMDEVSHELGAREEKEKLMAKREESMKHFSIFDSAIADDAVDICQKLEAALKKANAPYEKIYMNGDKIYVTTVFTSDDSAKTRSDKAIVRDAVCKNSLGIQNIQNIEGQPRFFININDVRDALSKLDSAASNTLGR